MEIKETRIFGRTRCELVAEWRGNHKNSAEIERSLSAISEIRVKEKLRQEYHEAFEILEERRGCDDLGYYIGLAALYAAFIRHGLYEWSEQTGYIKLLNLAIVHTQKLYYRDAIIFELYLHEERGLEWD